jgi:hypothetical protein
MVLHFCLIAMFFWVLLEGCVLYNDLVVVIGTSIDNDQLYKIGRYVAYGLPLLIVILGAAIDHEDYFTSRVGVRACVRVCMWKIDTLTDRRFLAVLLDQRQVSADLCLPGADGTDGVCEHGDLCVYPSQHQQARAGLSAWRSHSLLLSPGKK